MKRWQSSFATTLLAVSNRLTGSEMRLLLEQNGNVTKNEAQILLLKQSPLGDLANWHSSHLPRQYYYPSRSSSAAPSIVRASQRRKALSAVNYGSRLHRGIRWPRASQPDGRKGQVLSTADCARLPPGETDQHPSYARSDLWAIQLTYPIFRPTAK